MTSPTANGDRRLLLLADLLDTLPDHSLDMYGWMQYLIDGDYTEEVTAEGIEQGVKSGVIERLDESTFKLAPGAKPEAMEACGFAACAIGWAGTIPELVREGFSVQSDWDKRDLDAGLGATPVPVFGQAEGYTAVELFFELEPERYEPLRSAEWQHLFGSHTYYTRHPDPSTVAKRIREFVTARQSK